MSRNRLAGNLSGLCLAGLFCSLSVAAAGPAFSFGVELDPASRYVWRGMDQGMGPVLQPSAWGSTSGFTLSLWSNVGMGREFGFGRITEVDPGLAYSTELLGFGLDPSVTCFLYPGEEDPFGTVEVTVGLSRTVGPVEVFTDHSLDIVGYPGAYYGDAGLGFEQELTPGLPFAGSASLGWATAEFNDECLGVRRAALNCAEAEVSLTWTTWGLVYLRPHVGASLLLDSALRQAVDRPFNFTAGLAMGREF